MIKTLITAIILFLHSVSSLAIEHEKMRSDPGWRTGIDREILYVEKVFSTDNENQAVGVSFTCAIDTIYSPVILIVVTMTESLEDGKMSFLVRDGDTYDRLMTGRPAIIRYGFESIYIDLSHDKQYLKLVAKMYEKCVSANAAWRVLNEKY